MCMLCLKAAQVCAYELGISMDLIKVQATNSVVTAESITTGGSITSENVCAVCKCIEFLPFKYRINKYMYTRTAPMDNISKITFLISRKPVLDV